MQYAPNIGIWWRQGVCTSVAEIPSLHISSTDDLCLFLLPTEKKSRKIWPTSRSIEIIPSPNELWPHSIFPRWAPVPARHQVWFWRSGFRKFPVSSWHDPCHHVFFVFFQFILYLVNGKHELIWGLHPHKQVNIPWETSKDWTPFSFGSNFILMFLVKRKRYEMLIHPEDTKTFASLDMFQQGGCIPCKRN